MIETTEATVRMRRRELGRLILGFVVLVSERSKVV